jgi:hypothetical protein
MRVDFSDRTEEDDEHTGFLRSVQLATFLFLLPFIPSSQRHAAMIGHDPY